MNSLHVEGNGPFILNSQCLSCHLAGDTRGYCISSNGPLTRYVTLRVAHAPGMPGTFSSAAEFKGNRELTIPVCITVRVWRTCRDACRDCSPAVAGKTFPAFPICSPGILSFPQQSGWYCFRFDARVILRAHTPTSSTFKTMNSLTKAAEK